MALLSNIANQRIREHLNGYKVVEVVMKSKLLYLLTKYLLTKARKRRPREVGLLVQWWWWGGGVREIEVINASNTLL